MQLTFVVDVDEQSNSEGPEDVASFVEDRINEMLVPGTNRLLVQKVFLTNPTSLVKIDSETADRIYT